MSENHWRTAAIRAWENSMEFRELPHYYVIAERHMDAIRRLIDAEENSPPPPSEKPLFGVVGDEE